MKYLAGFVTGSGAAMADNAYFSSYISKTAEPIVWFLLFMGVTAIIVLLGVEKGIEKVSKFMMPVLVVLIFGISIYTICTMDGALDGVVYYLKPDFSKFSVMTVVAAMGQMFYSMSLSMGIMITFGSYMKKDTRVEKSARQIEWFDTGVAFLAGLMIIPAVFAFSGGDEAALGQGPGLMFVTLPKIFDSMPGGVVIGAAFFLMVLFAALTSAISLMETIVSIFLDKLGLSRKTACLLVFAICVILGLLSCLGYSVWSGIKIIGMQFLDLFDFLSNSVMMPLVAFATCIFVGYIVKPKTLIEEIEQSGPFRQQKLFCVMIKYIAPIFTLLILVSSVLDVLGIVKI